MLERLPPELKRRDFDEMRLSVYADNERAAGLYERMGWRPSGEPMPHSRGGRPE
ncbi:GNAT family N-acetyltransferase [Aminobacter sp. Piv2-1]|uniref:GNAT family N-acetyltransferase n=1 Tax=Aminobacter sp. Piv2-1 TaxID=3031122 RepID=UPI0030A9219E